MWNKIKDIISQYLEISETRRSIVVMVLIGITIMGLYKAYLGNDIPSNLGNIILTLSGYIFGINTINGLSNVYESYKNSKVSVNGNNQNINGDNETINNDINGGV